MIAKLPLGLDNSLLGSLLGGLNEAVLDDPRILFGEE